MKIFSIKNWLGFILILLSTSIAVIARMYQEQHETAGWMYVVATALFLFGGPMAFDLTFRSLFGLKEKPRYIYRPEAQQILVRFDSVPFMIERDGLKIRLVMTLGVPTSEKFMFVCEPEVGLDFAFRATGSDGGRELALRDGSKLYFIRRHAGIKVLWKDVNRPWKVVEESE